MEEEKLDAMQTLYNTKKNENKVDNGYHKKSKITICKL
jgi:hypothetical protein